MQSHMEAGHGKRIIVAWEGRGRRTVKRRREWLRGGSGWNERWRHVMWAMVGGEQARGCMTGDEDDDGGGPEHKRIRGFKTDQEAKNQSLRSPNMDIIILERAEECATPTIHKHRDQQGGREGWESNGMGKQPRIRRKHGDEVRQDCHCDTWCTY